MPNEILLHKTTRYNLLWSSLPFSIFKMSVKSVIGVMLQMGLLHFDYNIS